MLLLFRPGHAGTGKVYLYYWEPTHDSVGHVALHLYDDEGDVYVSFWPEKHGALIHNLFGYRGVWHGSLLEDRQHEDYREPSSLDLSGLDESAIRRFFLEEKDKPLKWGVLQGDTCVSVASNALRAGGLPVTTCRGSVPSCRRDLERSYVQFLKHHPRAMAALAAAAAAPMSQLPTATAPVAQPATQLPQARGPEIRAWTELPRAQVPTTATAAIPAAAEAASPPPSRPMVRPGCPGGYYRDRSDGQCYPRDTYQPDRGAGAPTSAPQPTNFGPGEGLKSR